MCDSGDRRRACIFVHLDNLDIIVTATKPPFSWTKALRLYYIRTSSQHPKRSSDAEMFRRRAPAAAPRAKGKAKGITRFELDVSVNNPIAINLYKKLGFVIEGERQQSYLIDGEFDNDYIMAKII